MNDKVKDINPEKDVEPSKLPKEICEAILGLLDRVELKGKQEARVMVACEQALEQQIKELS